MKLVKGKLKIFKVMQIAQSFQVGKLVTRGCTHQHKYLQALGDKVVHSPKQGNNCLMVYWLILNPPIFSGRVFYFSVKGRAEKRFFKKCELVAGGSAAFLEPPGSGCAQYGMESISICGRGTEAAQTIKPLEFYSIQ